MRLKYFGGLKSVAALLLCALTSTVHAAPFADLYFEAVGQTRAQTVSGLLQPRWGLTNGSDTWPRWEGYLALRLGGDSRTLFANDQSIVFDNYIFSGVGLDYVGLLPGVRLTSQFGYSRDLVPRQAKSGIDFRAGWLSYHEVPIPGVSLGGGLREEIYTEGLYMRRHRNFFMNAQARTFLAALYRESKGNIWELGPFINLSLSADAEGVNRYGEVQAGGRARYQGDLSVSLGAYAVNGVRFGSGTGDPAYTDFRVLLSGGTEF